MAEEQVKEKETAAEDKAESEVPETEAPKAEAEETKADETEAEGTSEAKAEEEPEKASEEKPAEAEEKKEEKKEDEDLKNQFLRLSADFQNYKRRTEKEKSDIYAYANEKIVLQLLDVIDNFDRAMAAASDEQGKFAEGMTLILKQLNGILEKNNVEEIKALGEVFDPAFHNAVMNDANSDVESGRVSKVFQKGYMLNKKVIRPAMVAVAQ